MFFFKKYHLCFLISLLFISSNLVGLNECFAAEKKSITWGTTSATSGLFTYFVSTAKILNEEIPEINITVRATGGSVHDIRLMEKREIDIAAADTKIVWDAINGIKVFEGKPFPDLRLLYVSMTNPVQFVVSEKSGIKDFYGLEGKLFTPGILGSSAEQIAMDVFKVIGVRPKIRHSSLPDAIEAMKSETIVGLAKAGVPDSVILELLSAMKIRILSLSDEDIEKIVKNVNGLKKAVVPSGVYKGIGEFKTIEMEYSDYVRKDFPEELAYKIVKSIWKNRAAIKNISSTFVGDRLVDVSLGVNSGFMHPGAIKFYRELGYKVPKTLVPPEMGEK